MYAPARNVAVAAVVIALVAPTTAVALLTDADASANNAAVGGTLDPKLSELGPATQDGTTDERFVDGVRDAWEDQSHATDGSETVDNTVALNNSASSLAADSVAVTVRFAENDTSLGSAGNPNETARTIAVETFAYDGTDLVGETVTDENGNGFVDVDDLIRGSTAENLTALSGVRPGETATLNVSLSGTAGLLSGVGSGDGIDIEFEFGVRAGGFAEADSARNNTVRYA